ncbi:calcium ATPase [Lophium mytilinum]|uniref:Calcium ATPase n=1 Tax=Lophium mytilinum TaxID=390894 RepID=A0A6A6R4X6_9PEZI|nr:calcium ATPase [Lophium mytilinum]
MADPDLVHDIESAEKPAHHVRYAEDVDSRPTRARARRDSNDDGMSIRSISRRRIVEPGVVLPTAYRTLSINIEDSKSLDVKEPKHSKTKENASVEDLDWHIISTEEAARRLSTSTKNGLSNDQVARRLKEHGRNVLSAPPSRWLIKTLGYLFGGFGSILLTASILVFIAWKPLGQPPAIANLALGIVLAIVFVIQAAFSFFQDWSTSRVMDSIKNMLPDECIVIREGERVKVLGTEITQGDILCIKMGDKLPADVRFIEVSGDVKFDRSILTGETLPTRGSVESTDNNYLETECIGMAGTHCTAGTAVAIVVATGDRSVFGRIAKMTNTPKTGLTNLEKEIYYFVAAIVAIMLTMILVVIIVWASWLRHSHPGWISVPVLIVDCVSVAVAFIPEGLPIAVTASLTITASIMKKNKILCKSLKTVETLGSVSTICSDKTGTLTKNQMTVTDCMVHQAPTSASDAAAIAQSTRISATRPANTEGFAELGQISAICNAAEIDAATAHLALEDRKYFGDATDQAVLRFAESLNDVAQIRTQWKVINTVAFNSKNKFMITVARPATGNVHFKGEDFEPSPLVLFIKGAPDILLPRCSSIMTSNGSAQSLPTNTRTAIEAVKDKWSSEAKRVILMARKHLSPELSKLDPQSREFENMIMSHVVGGLELVGLVGLVDPPRDEIPSVIRTLRGAGIKVHMVTGDFQLTAEAIAVSCGIITNRKDRIDNIDALSRQEPSSFNLSEERARYPALAEKAVRSIVLSGPDMMDLDEEQWDRLCQYDEIVFARTTPEQKLRIVKELQARKEIVGMTGDGVNDAPSLKQADIGIAMGSGSDIAIEAADMVLLESFSAIVEAVKYGRVVFDNLKKTICYLLPAGSFSEFWPVMTNVLFGLPQILSSFLMIIICCFTDCAAATAIAYEKPEADVLLQRPRNPAKDHLVDWKLVLHSYGFIGVLETVSSFAMAYWYAERKGLSFSVLWFGFGASPDGMTTDEMTGILNTASSIYFVNLVVMQWFNLFGIRTRRLSFFQHPPVFRKSTRNLYLFPAIVFSLLIAIFFLYVPKFHVVLGTATVPVGYWFLPMAFGMAILLLDEGRKFVARRSPKGILAKIAW